MIAILERLKVGISLVFNTVGGILLLLKIKSIRYESMI